MQSDLAELLAHCPAPKILVLGDLMLDRYTWGDAERVSPEAPVLVLQADLEEVRLGGAASVANLLRALNTEVVLAGVTGDDSTGRVMRALLAEAQVDSSAVVCDPNRITTSKDRFIGRAANRHPNQILRVDREVRHCIPAPIEQELLTAIIDRLDEIQVVLVSDYAKGVCTPALLQAVFAAAFERGIPVFVDPARITDYERYRGATLLVPNRAEAEMATSMPIGTHDDAAAAGKELCARYGMPMTLVKLDQDGIVLVRKNGPCEHFPARPRKVYDVTGAGDMVLAVAGLCSAGGMSWNDTVRIANSAAGLEVEQAGVVTVAREEICRDLRGHASLANKIVTLPELVPIAAKLRQTGKTIVFTNGCFDLLHVGHITYLLEAANLGDVLVVAVNSDASVRRLKGPKRPVFAEGDRAKMLASLGCVQHVVIFEEDTPHALLDALRPEMLVKGGTYSAEEVVGHEMVTAYGGRVQVLSLVDGVSTTRIIAEIIADVMGTNTSKQTF